MESIIIKPKSRKEHLFLLDLFDRMNIETMFFTKEDKEDLGLLKLMKEADRNDTVSEAEIMKMLE
jgi:hypothetical protein